MNDHTVPRTPIGATRPRRTRVVAGLAMLGLALGLGPVCQAQEASEESLQEEVDRLRERLDELERWKAEREAESGAEADPQGDAGVDTDTDPDAGSEAGSADPAGGDAAPGSTSLLPDDPLFEPGRDLDELLGKEHPNTDFGGFGIRLGQYGIEPYIHAYTTQSFLAAWNYPHARSASGSLLTLENSFFMSEFAVMLGANIRDRIIPELQLVYETGTSRSGVDARAIHLRYGQIDIHIDDLLTVRVGKFLVPFGRYNESLYPDFLFPISRLLLVSFVNIVPVVWADTGVQVRGRYRISEDLELDYAAYVVNGLRQDDTSTVPGVVDDGGPILAMKRENDADLGSGMKSYGGRVGIKAWRIDAGLSFMGGAYTPDSRQNLYMAGYYFYLRWKGLTIGSEAVLVEQERARPNHDLHKRGGFAFVSYRFYEVPLPVIGYEVDVEPVVAFDYSHLGDEGEVSYMYLAGLQLYFLPKHLPNAKLAFTGGVLDTTVAPKEVGLFLMNLSVAF